jgi:hypothetical protein
MRKTLLFIVVLCGFSFASSVCGEEPTVSYIFPAGGQRGTAVKFHVGGHFLHGEASFRMYGRGVATGDKVREVPTLWFEGPVIPLPASQQKEDYPKDHLGEVVIAKDAPLGERLWRVWTSQGATPAMKFIVGELPEVVEDEIDGEPIPVPVTLPVTVNGRIFPREDVDIWSFTAQKGQTVWCEVQAARLGSPLESRLEIRGPQGQMLAENAGYFGSDAFVRFTAPADGIYQVRIHDSSFDGLQHYVYRLTISKGPHVEAIYPAGGRRNSELSACLIGANVHDKPVKIDLAAEPGETAAFRQVKVGDALTNPFLLEVGDLPEMLENEPNNSAAQARHADVPLVANGRIDQPGDVDCWSFKAAKGQSVQLDLRAARLGAPLDSVLKVTDASGKELARSDDLGGNETDSQLTFRAPADGTYVAQVEEQFSNRGGPRFIYRLTINNVAPPADFQLSLGGDALTVLRAGQARVRLDVLRSGGFNGPVELKIEGVPPGVTVSPTVIPAGQNGVQLAFKADASARIGGTELTITGSAELGPGKERVTRSARVAAPRGSLRLDQLFLAVGVPTPFKFKSTYALVHAGRGATFRKRYQLERKGYTGPLTVVLADRQARHLQGVAGPAIVIPPEANEFEYAVQLPPWLEIGRTSRTVLMAVGEIVDVDGSRHRVSFSSQAQNEQIVVLADAGPISITALKTSLLAQPRTTVELPLRIERAKEVQGPVTVQALPAKHMRGVSAEAVTVSEGQTEATLIIRFGSEPGPFNLPLLIRASGLRANDPVLAETKVEVAPVARE